MARDVCVFEHGLHVRPLKALGVVLDARARARECPLRRVVGGDAHAPALEVRDVVRLARERVDDRAELQAAQHAQLEREPAFGERVGKLRNVVGLLSQV